MPLRMCFILVVCFATLITQNVPCRCQCCRGVGCGQPSSPRRDVVQNCFQSRSSETWGPPRLDTQPVRLQTRCVSGPFGKPGEGSGDWGAALELKGPRSPIGTMATAQEVSPLAFQSRTAAAIFPSLCSKKITALVIPRVPSTKKWIPPARDPSSLYLAIASLKLTQVLFLEGICNSQTHTEQSERVECTAA